MKELKAIIDVKELIKNYGTFPVFDRLSLTINKGSCTGLAGLNGSGKTTLFKCLLGFTDVNHPRHQIA